MARLPLPSLDANNQFAWERLYASTSEPVWGSQPVGFLERFLPRADSLVDGEILDAAAGEGRNLPPLLRLGRPVTACDASPSALAKIPPAVAARVSTVVCGLGHVPVPGARFAFALLSDTIETLPDPEPALAELRRILAPGGLLLANIPDGSDGIAGANMRPLNGTGWLYQERYFYRFYPRREAEALLAEAGFDIASVAEHAWHETTHPRFRDGPHLHRSWIFLARRPG